MKKHAGEFNYHMLQVKAVKVVLLVAKTEYLSMLKDVADATVARDALFLVSSVYDEQPVFAAVTFACEILLRKQKKLLLHMALMIIINKIIAG